MFIVVCLAFCACSGGSLGGSEGSDTTSGPVYTMPSSIEVTTFTSQGATNANGASIDISHVNEGYVGAKANNNARLKFQVSCNGQDYNYDLPGDGTPIFCAINMGSGSYNFRVMQNTTADRYIEICSQSTTVSLDSESDPFLYPTYYCEFDEDSNCVQLARSLVQNSTNEGDALKEICNYITENITYDIDKAERLSGTTGYVPDPDDTLATGSGICFDYASLAAAMLRSVGIPTQIITGYVSPDNIYHAWIMVYIEGTWHSAQFKVDAETWTRVDLTFAAADQTASKFVGDGTDYTDRYVY